MRWELKFVNVLYINLLFLSANIIHNMYMKNCGIIRHNNKQRLLNPLHVSIFLCHLEGVTQQKKIHKWLVSFLMPSSRWPRKAEN